MTDFYLGSINLNIFSKDSITDIINYNFLFKVKLYSSNEIKIIDIIHQSKNFKLVNNLLVGSILKFNNIMFNEDILNTDICKLINDTCETPLFKFNENIKEFISFNKEMSLYFDCEYSYLYAAPSVNYLVKNVILKNKLLKESDIIKILANNGNGNKIRNTIQQLKVMKNMLKTDIVFFGTPARDYQYWDEYIDNLINNLDD